MQRRLTDGEKKSISEAWALLFISGNVSSELQGVRDILAGMIYNNTTDGRPYVDPPLTDEDARQRPWVMVRDNEAEPWRGPRALAACCGGDYYTFTPSVCGIIGFRYCRCATPDEIASAGLEVAE
jgi:hypothetical protein